MSTQGSLHPLLSPDGFFDRRLPSSFSHALFTRVARPNTPIMTDTSPTATKRSSSSSTSKAVSTRASSRTDVDSLLQPDSEHPTIKTSSRDHPISIPVKFECGLDVSAISDHYKPTTHEHLLEGAPDELATRVDPEGKEKGEERDLDLIEFEGSNDPYNPKVGPLPEGPHRLGPDSLTLWWGRIDTLMFVKELESTKKTVPDRPLWPDDVWRVSSDLLFPSCQHRVSTTYAKGECGNRVTSIAAC